MRLARIVALALAIPVGASGQRLSDDPRVAQALRLMQTWLEAQRAYEQIPGISVALVREQQLLWSGGYGYADVARQKPATSSTIYSICSISKLFTSVATLQLRDAGKLSAIGMRGRPWLPEASRTMSLQHRAIATFRAAATGEDRQAT